MTWIEIVDTSIKIGLGAFIGGLFAYILNKQIYNHEIEKVEILDNRQALKDICTKFENIHANVIALALAILREFDSYKREASAYIVKAKSGKSSPKAKIPKLPDFYKRRFDTSERLILDLYLLQGVIMLYGYKKMESIIYNYTGNVKAISPGNQTKESLGNIPDPDAIQKFNDLRNEFYEAAQSYFRIT